MQPEPLSTQYLLHKAVEFMLLKQEFWPMGSIEDSSSLSKALSMGMFGTNCYFDQIDGFLTERSRIRKHSSKIRSYVGDPASYLVNYLSNPASDEFYRIRIEIFCLIFNVCVKLYTHTGFKFSSEKFCIQNDRKIRLYKTPKKKYVSIISVNAKSIFSWSKKFVRGIIDDAIFGEGHQTGILPLKRKQQMLVRQSGSGHPNGEFKYVSNFPDHFSSVRYQKVKQDSDNGLKSSSKEREATPFMSSISQDNIQMVHGLGARNIPKSTKAVVSRELPSETLDYGSISNPFEQFLSQCQKIDDTQHRQRPERSASNSYKLINSCDNQMRQQKGDVFPSELRHSSAEKMHHPIIKPNETTNSQLQKGIQFKKLPSSVSSNRSGFSNAENIEFEIKEQRRLLRIFESQEEEHYEDRPNHINLLSGQTAVSSLPHPLTASLNNQELPIIAKNEIISEFATKQLTYTDERKLSENSQEPLVEVPKQEHFQKKLHTEKTITTNSHPTVQSKKKTKKKACDKQVVYNPKYKEKIDTQFYVGNLKFYDPSTDFGFLTTYFDGNFHDIFAHKEELAKAGLLQSALTFHKTGEILTIKFQIATYFGKYKQSKKAMNLERVDSQPQSSALQSLVNTKTAVNFV